MFTGKYFVEKLNMKEHPEGGYYNECLKSGDIIDAKTVDSSFDGNRKLWTSIYFLLKDRDVSRFHRLKSDEIWYYHSGVPMVIHIINKNGELERVKLGLDIERGERPQVLIPKGCIFGAIMLKENIFTLQYLFAFILIITGVVIGINSKAKKEKI